MPELQIVTAVDPAWAEMGTAAQQAALGEPVRRLHQAVLTHFLDEGRPPHGSWLDDEARSHGLDPVAAFAELAAADLVLLDDARRARVAYPFSGAPTPHRVHLAGGPTVWAMCALDALGIPQMTGRDAGIESIDPHDGGPVHVDVRGGQWRWDPPETTMIYAYAVEGGQSAQCACPHVNFVTSRDHAQAYLADRPGLIAGLFTQEDAVALAGSAFGSLLPDRGSTTG